MKYESEGLFIGLVSFPFYEDGGDLFDKVFRPFFMDHKDGHLKKIYQDLSDDLYEPYAYRMFGSHSLAIFSLIDDYAFSSRVFNLGHLDVSIDDELYQAASKCKATVLTGSSVTEEDAPYLLTRAKETFLSTVDRYPFVDIIRIKIKCKLLEKRGYALIAAIRKQIESIRDGIDSSGMQIIITDSYDIYELIVCAFSTSLSSLCKLSDRIRNLKGGDLTPTKVKCIPADVHVIEACHENYGVHADFKMGEDVKHFREWRKDDDKLFNVNLIVETIPGHRDLFVQSIVSESRIKAEEKKPKVTITGGGFMQYTLGLDAIPWIYEMAKDKSSWFKRNAVKMKLTLSKDDDDEVYAEEHDCGMQVESRTYEKVFIDEVRTSLAVLGVSKTVREHVLSLFKLYTYCCSSRIQSYYFDEIKKSVLNLKCIIDGFAGDAVTPLVEIERILNEEVNSLKIAFSDRVNNLEQNSVLEYGCGIHQILHGFGSAYQSICQVLDRSDDIKYSFVVAKSKECSTATHIEVNINHIIYPDLFVTTVWKEASNFSYEELRYVMESMENEGQSRLMANPIFSDFYSFINNRSAQNHIMSVVYSELMDNYDDETCMVVLKILEKENLNLVKYVLSDTIVYHFAFQDDLPLMWESYFKAFLQMSSNYCRLGKPLMKPLIFMLLRLFMVSFSDITHQGENMKFICDKMLKPFDSILSNLWYLCYRKTFECSKRVYDEWEKYRFCNLIELMNNMYDTYTLDYKPTTEDIYNVRSSRKERVDRYMRSVIDNEVLEMDVDVTPKENVISILNAFTLAVHKLDDSQDVPIHCLLRNPQNGEIWSEKYNDKILKRSAKILADPDGGFVVPDSNVRKKYFAHRTWLYRTLWDFSYRTVSS